MVICWKIHCFHWSKSWHPSPLVCPPIAIGWQYWQSDYKVCAEGLLAWLLIYYNNKTRKIGQCSHHSWCFLLLVQCMFLCDALWQALCAGKKQLWKNNSSHVLGENAHNTAITWLPKWKTTSKHTYTYECTTTIGMPFCTILCNNKNSPHSIPTLNIKPIEDRETQAMAFFNSCMRIWKRIILLGMISLSHVLL